MHRYNKIFTMYYTRQHPLYLGTSRGSLLLQDGKTEHTVVGFSEFKSGDEAH